MKRILDDIKTKQFKKVYLLYGNETYLIREIGTRLVNALTGDDTMNTLTIADRAVIVSEVRDFTDTMPFFAERRVVVLEDSRLFSSSDPLFSDWIESLPDTAVVVFIEYPVASKDKGDPMSMGSPVDKRSRLFKTVQKTGLAVELNRLEGDSRQEWLLREVGRRKVRITKNAFQLLNEVLPDAMESALHELDKLADYAGENGAIDEASVEAVITPKLTYQVYKLVEAAISKDRKTAFRLYYDMVALDTEPMMILNCISRELMRLYTAASMKQRRASNQEIASALNVQDFVVRKLLSTAGRIPFSFIETEANQSLEYDRAVKSGDLSAGTAVELLLFRLT